MKQPGLWWIGICAISALVGLSSFWLPKPLPADAPATNFSAARAFEHVKNIARAPHPSGTPENQRVREYLLAQMRALGLNPRELTGERNGVVATNLYGELPGSQAGTTPILLVAHYDSVPTGPGAADDSTGVATCLETIRSLKSRSQLRNTLGVLFTDAEENHGVCLGAFVFVRDQTNLMKNLRLVVNMEARGNQGPVLMFQTGRDNRELMRFFRRACPLPVTASFSEEVYRRMPNDTDLTEFLNAGKRGFNFAFVGGIDFYHSPRDTPENLSLRTLQHYGDCVTPLVAELGNADSDTLERTQKSGDATFFTICRGRMALYPASTAKLLAYATGALFLITLVAGLQNRAIRIKSLVASFGVNLLAAMVSLGIALAIVFGLVRQFQPRVRGPFIIGLPFTAGILAIILIIAASLTILLRRWLLARANFSESLASGLIIWAGLALAANTLLPGASYLFMWPALFGTFALFQSYSRAEQSISQLIFTAVPASALIAPTIALLHQTITIGIAPLSAALVCFAFCLMPPARRA
jgi:hypothetical protein